MAQDTRTEHDLVGEKEVPTSAYYGVHTVRAMENFAITGATIAQFPELIASLAAVKQAAATTNRELGLLPRTSPGRSSPPAKRSGADATPTSSSSTRSRAAQAPRRT